MWPKALWDALEESGLPAAWVSEDLGGAGAGMADGFAVLRVAGRFAAPAPIAETLIAGWLLGRAGIALPGGPLTVAPVHADGRITLGADGRLGGRARHVPFARNAGHIAVLAARGGEPVAALVATAGLPISQGRASPASRAIRSRSTARFRSRYSPSISIWIGWSHSAPRSGCSRWRGRSKGSSNNRCSTRSTARSSAGRSPSSRRCSTTWQPWRARLRRRVRLPTPRPRRAPAEIAHLGEVAIAKVRGRGGRRNRGGDRASGARCDGLYLRAFAAPCDAPAVGWREEFGNEAVWAGRLGEDGRSAGRRPALAVHHPRLVRLR